MTKRVEVNGQILEFPADMPDDQIESIIRQFNAPQSFEVNSAADYAKAIGGLGEVGLSGLTSFARQIPLGLAGIAGTIAGLVPGGESPNEKANRWMQNAPIPGPYEPRLGPAQVLSRGLAEATEPVARGAEWLEDLTETPFPLLNTVLKTAVVGGPQVLPGAASIKALRSAPAPAGTFVPSINDLYRVGRVAFNEARINGGGIKPEALSRLRRGVSEFRNEAGVRIGFNEKLHPQAVAVQEEIFKALDEGIDFDRLLELREMAGGVAGNADRAIAMRGVLLKNQIDDFVDSLKPSDVISGDPAKAASSLNTARALWRDASKARTIEEQIELAGNRAGQFSGSGYENALRTQFRQLNARIIKGQEKGWTAAEREAIATVANGGKLDNLWRALGKLAPTGVVSGGIGAGIGYTAFGPVGAAVVPAGGALGRLAATRGTIGNAQKALELPLMRSVYTDL